jgi:hypothetical protein
MKHLLIIVFALALSVSSSAQNSGTTKTICKNEPLPSGYTIVGEAESSDCPNKAWVIRKRTPKLVLDQGGQPGVRVPEEDVQPVGVAEPGSSSEDVEFAKRMFELLSSGDMAVEEMVDWDNLKLSGLNFGAVMKELATANKQEVGDFRRQMISNFGEQFRQSQEAALTRWRVYSQDAQGTTVAANTSKGQVLLFTVSQQDGRRIVTALDEKKPGQK